MKPTRGIAATGRARAKRLAGGLAVLFAATLCAWTSSPLAAQGPAGLWAAQTGPDQVTLAWNEVPGATEYRIHLGTPGGAPIQRLGGNARRSVLVGVQRAAGGVFLVGVGAGGSVLRQAQFNPVIPATSFPPVTAPAAVTAAATAATEITISWPAVPGATAYYIGRAVTGSGSRPLCGLCSTEPRYQDRGVMPGLTHTYAVSAIFPNGTSRRVSSNPVDPGAAAASEAASQVLTPTSTTPTTSTVTATSTSGGAATTTTTSSSAGTSDPLATAVSSAFGTVLETVAPPSGVTASVVGPAAVRLTWQPSSTAGVTEYRLYRSVNGSRPILLNNVSATTTTYTDAFFPITLFAAGPVRVSYNIVASTATASSAMSVTSGAVTVQPPAGGATASAPVSCKLDYQRADNMWAQYGRPDGLLGTEAISLAGGQDKVFITDWKYEKQRNDGTNYYGSHLRIATNGTAHTIRLHLRSLTLTGLREYARTGSDTFWIRMEPGQTLLFQADLMEVFCEN